MGTELNKKNAAYYFSHIIKCSSILEKNKKVHHPNYQLYFVIGKVFVKYFKPLLNYR